MKEFHYVITDKDGIHARPAGMLAKEARRFESTITVGRVGEEKSVDVTRLMALMGLAVKCGQTVEVSVEGADEETAVVEMQKFFEENL